MQKSSDPDNTMFALLPSAAIKCDSEATKPNTNRFTSTSTATPHTTEELGFVSYTFQKDPNEKSQELNLNTSAASSYLSSYYSEESFCEENSCDILGTVSAEGDFVPSEVSVRLPDVYNGKSYYSVFLFTF